MVERLDLGSPLVALTVLVHAFSLVASAIVFARDGSCAEAPVAEDPCAPRDLSTRSLDVRLRTASQKALFIVRLTRCVSALQAELPTNVPTLVEF